MKYKCQKCKSKFISQYLLDKHLNRETSCDIKIKCNKCDKEFQNKFILEKYLKRKNPCVRIIIEASSRIEIIEAEKKAKLEIEMQKHKNRMELEELKNQRKERTATIINNDNRIQIINNIEVHINNTIPADNIVDCSDYLVQKIIPKLVDTMGEYKFLEYQEEGNMSYIIKDLFNNINRPALRNMLYYPKNDMCFVVLNKKWALKDFEYISGILEKSLIPCIEKLLIFLEPGSDKFDTPEFHKHNEFKFYLQQLRKSALNLNHYKKQLIREELE